MRQILKRVLIISIAIFAVQSCIDKDYDDINKGGVIPIPPLQIKVDPIKIGEVESLIIPPGTEIELPSGKYKAVNEVISGVFSGDAIKDFFYDGAKRIELSLRIILGSKAESGDYQFILKNARIDLYFNVLDKDRKGVTELPTSNLYFDNEGICHIKEGNKLIKDNQIKIAFSEKNIADMQNEDNAPDSLEIVVIVYLDNGSQIIFNKNDIIQLEEVILKNSGMYIKL